MRDPRNPPSLQQSLLVAILFYYQLDMCEHTLFVSHGGRLSRGPMPAVSGKSVCPRKQSQSLFAPAGLVGPVAPEMQSLVGLLGRLGERLGMLQ